MIHYSYIHTPIGKIFVAQSKKGVCRIALPGESEEALFAWLKKHFPEEPMVKSDHGSSFVKAEFTKYFAGQLKEFSFPLDLQTTSFRRKALKKVHQIPYGETASYKEIAEQMGNPGAIRAVGGANANNPLPIVIPCHRVIAHDGSLGGYGGSLNLKAKLLQLEGAL